MLLYIWLINKSSGYEENLSKEDYFLLQSWGDKYLYPFLESIEREGGKLKGNRVYFFTAIKENVT